MDPHLKASVPNCQFKLLLSQHHIPFEVPPAPAIIEWLNNADRMRDGQVGGERLWASLMELVRISATPKAGMYRLAASDQDGAASS
jgi:hypothetical protein